MHSVFGLLLTPQKSFETKEGWLFEVVYQIEVFARDEVIHVKHIFTYKTFDKDSLLNQTLASKAPLSSLLD